jgi:spore germination protein KC
MLSACYDSNEIENLAYVMAIGIDEADSNSFNLTFQTAVPKSISGSGGGGGGGGESTDITSFKTDNFISGLKKANEYLNTRINLSHTQIIVLSEKVAKKGVLAFLNGLQENLEIRPDVKIIVSADGAKKYIESIQPKLTNNPAKYYDLLFKSYETDFLVKYTQLEDFLLRANDFGAQPVAVYTQADKAIDAGSKEKKDDAGEGKQDSGKKDDDKKNIMINGLAIFNKDKLIGKLEPKEATLFALLTGSNRGVKMEVQDPFDSRFKVLGNVAREKSSYTKVKIRNGKPEIDEYLRLTVDIQAMQSDVDYNTPDKTAKLKKAYEDYLNKGLQELFSKVAYEYKSDIFGYGELAKRNFMTIKEWKNAKWPDIFPKSVYNYKIELRILRQG